MAVLQPNGPLPAAVYWRRRAIAAAVLIAVIVMLIWLVVAAAGHDDAEQAVHPPGPSGAAWRIPPAATTGVFAGSSAHVGRFMRTP